ncbi:MAG: hypothetical protein A2Z25_04590 [Planctomycetes bacterium RBG_16_55_9]|nr:MAG: hypothetical protein A2Z25_04590 [Planctomycetes bacterium RBG_16_55_9]
MNVLCNRKLLLGMFLAVLALMSVGVCLGAEDTFNVSVSSGGTASGGGSGYNNGRWYYYPYSQWYSQWFYDGPYDPAGSKRIEWTLRIGRIDTYASAAVKIGINWTTDQWKSDSAPPLPSDVSSASQENQLIRRQIIRESSISSTTNISGFLELDFCPTWVSIDIQGNNVEIQQGIIVHTCTPGQQYEYDYGDAPYPPYPTLKAQNGASHVIDNRVYLGARVDAEADGQPNATATGDDNNLDDEDGATFTTLLVPGDNATVDVAASTFGILNAWIDFNGDGDWADADEHVFIDQALFTGNNSLPFTVPNNAVPGNTFCRFRFSSAAGLNYTGEAFNGEVEDHAVRIEEKYEAGQYLKWEQPPIEYDPYAQAPVYCGWDQPSYVVIQGDYGGSYTAYSEWKIAADDFRCVGSGPVASVHWWGSYVGWNQTSFPSQRPAAWLLGFWSNVPADVDTYYSHPDRLLKAVIVPASDVDEVWVGRDRFPDKSAETCYKYTVFLKPDQYFQQKDYLQSTTDNVFWLSVTALYQGTFTPSYPWGWKTRPAPWNDESVTFTVQTPTLSSGYKPPTSGIRPTVNSAVCSPDESGYDLAFVLDTTADYVKWDQPFTGLRDWAHYEDVVSLASDGGAANGTIKWELPPDLTNTGVDVDATKDFPQTWPPQILADDFECTYSSSITGIDLYGSWFYDTLPGDNASDVWFTLNIHSNVPATQTTGYSKPGAILWTQTFAPGEFSVQKHDADIQSFYSPCRRWYIPNNHRDVYQYSFQIDPQKAFYQTGTTQQPAVYWLSVQAYVVHKPGYNPTRWGWKTSTDEWNDVAVYAESIDPNTANWQKLDYPTPHSYYGRKVGLAFTITSAGQNNNNKGLFIQYQVADDWLCNTNYPVTAATWWGSYKGYYYRPCACQDLPAPKKPDYFWLSIWSNSPDLYPNDPLTFGKPAQLVWEHKAYDYDEVLVGYDKVPEGPGYEGSYEPVYRYSVRIPKQYWYYQDDKEQVCWFSVVAVYQDLSTVAYEWGWTNHQHAYNYDAVTTVFPFDYPGDNIFWSPLYDQTGASEDTSFTLFTDPAEYPAN